MNAEYVGQPTYEEGRKPHRRVSQDEYLYALREVGSGLLEDFAEHFDVSEGTARRQLDGLVVQGHATVLTRYGAGRCYVWTDKAGAA